MQHRFTTSYFLYFVTALALLTIMLGACIPQTIQPVVQDQGAPEPVKLKVLLLPYLGFGPFFIAAEEGYFAEEGLDVEFISLNRSSAALPVLAQGEMDVAVASLNTGLLNLIATDGTVQVIANKGRYDPKQPCAYAGILAKNELLEDDELATADVRGQNVALNSPAGIGGYYVEKVLREANLTLDDIEITSVPAPAIPDALQNGAVDLAFSGEPWITRNVDAGHSKVWVRASDTLPNFDISYILFGPSLLEDSPESGQRFLRAYLKSVLQYNEGKTERNLEIIQKYTELDLELLKKVCWIPIPNDFGINMDYVQDFQTWAQEKGLLDKQITAEQFWDPTIIETALSDFEAK